MLLYHVVPVAALSSDLSDGQVLPTLAGVDLTVDLSEGVEIVSPGSTATVVAANNIAGNNVVHVIDTVLLLPFGTEEPTAEPVVEPTVPGPSIVEVKLKTVSTPCIDACHSG